MQPLVDPVPDASTHQPRILVVLLNVLLEVPDSVTHRMGVLANKERLVRLLRAFKRKVVNARIHDRIHVAWLVVALVVNRPSGIIVMDPLGGCFKVHPWSRFVTK